MRNTFFQTRLGRSLVLSLSVGTLGWYVVHAGCSRSTPEVVPAPAPAAPAASVQAAQPSAPPVKAAPAVDAGAPDAAPPRKKGPSGSPGNDPYFIPATKSAGIRY